MFARLLFPGRCCLCDAPGFDGMDICRVCVESLKINELPCRRCAFPLTSVRDPQSTLCGRCLTSRTVFDSTVSPYVYTYPADHIVQALKFSGRQKFGRLMGDLMARAIAERPGECLPQVLLPVPLHRARFRERGFNQSAVVARYCGKRLRIPVANNLLKRVVDTVPQTELSKAQRQGNIRKAFHLEKKMQARHVAIVDDVMTTGSTVRETARTLKRAGVERVDVWVFARTPL